MTFHLEIDSDTVGDAHTTPPLYVQHSDAVRQVLAKLKANNTGSAFVLREGKLAGIFTERDALHLMAGEGDLDVEVGQLMTANPVTLHEDDSVAVAILKMSQGGYRRLPL